MLKYVSLALAGAFAVNAQAATDISVWHSLSGVHAKHFGDLVEQYNRQQSDVKVMLKQFASDEALGQQLQQAEASRTLPTWVQWHASDSKTLYKIKGIQFENAQDVIKPVSKDAAVLSAAAVAPYLDENGKWAALPLTPAVPVIMYRLDAFKKAGLDPLSSSMRGWKDLQTVALQVRNSGYFCGIASVEPGWVHIENLAAWHNQLYATKNNGTAGGKPEFLFNDLLHVRHFALMVSWAKNDFMYFDKRSGAEAKWASGECPMALAPTTSMGKIDNLESAKVAVAPMPLWEEVSTQQGGLFPDGDGLYLPQQNNPEVRKAALKFAAWWLTPVIAAEWHQKSGSVPFTEAAYLATKKGGFYESVPGWESLSARLAATNTRMVTPLRIEDRRKVLDIIETELRNSYYAGKAPKAALDDAARAATALEVLTPAPAKTVKKGKK